MERTIRIQIKSWDEMTDVAVLESNVLIFRDGIRLTKEAYRSLNADHMVDARVSEELKLSTWLKDEAGMFKMQISDSMISKGDNDFQVVVWPGTVVEEGQDSAFEIFLKDEFDVEATYLETFVTLPNVDKLGRALIGAGGRKDAVFAVKNKDIQKFSSRRLEYGMRWWEDVVRYNFFEDDMLYSQEDINKYPVRW